MIEDLHVKVAFEALMLVTVVSAPPVLASMFTGILVGVAQAVTQVQDQSLALAFRVAAIFGALIAAGPWIFGRVASFATSMFELASLP